MIKVKKPKFDYLFIDESGDPGLRGSSYYICSVFHVNDLSLHQLNSIICNFRFMFDHYNELHSYHLSSGKLRKLNGLLRKKRRYFKCSSVYLDKKAYRGPYLRSIGSYSANSNRFRKYMYRQVLNLHFHKFQLDTSKAELVLDRSSLSNIELANLESYLNKYGKIPKKINYLTSVDSKYVDLIQLADLVCAHFKPDASNHFIKSGLSYSFINSKDISLENATGEVFP